MTEKTVKMLNEIKAKPGVYIGEKNLERLAMYLTGYVSCLVELTNKTTYFLIEIQSFIADYYNINSDQYWVDIIRFYTLSEEEAYDKFYELLDMFSNGNT